MAVDLCLASAIFLQQTQKGQKEQSLDIQFWQVASVRINVADDTTENEIYHSDAPTCSS